MIVSTKKKGNKTYYYLKHTIRKKNKIVTKEKYLGTQLPKNLGSIKQDFYIEINKELFEKLELIKKSFNLEWKRIPQTARKKELEEIAIAFTYNTNAIEGSTITLPESRMIIENNFSCTKPIKDVLETKKHSEVFLESLKKEEKITKKLLLKWHRKMFDETKKDIAGKFRNYNVRVGSYYAPDFSEVNQMLNNLVKFMKNSKHNPVEFAGRIHYIFEKIHPFGDGNGRIGRLLMNYVLWHKNYPMLIIEFKKRQSYYRALEKDEQGFVNYFIKTYIKAHKKILEKF
jgi:Fic family protein